jgi:GR25 family glycosyltransferase involved in LPS biosynthesis
VLVFCSLVRTSSALSREAPLPAYVVSLPEDAALLSQLRQSFASLLGEVYHVAALSGARDGRRHVSCELEQLPPTCEDAGELRTPRREHKVVSQELLGVLGCALSHLQAISLAYAHGHEAAVVLEDDVVPDIARFWTRSLSEFAAALPDDWRIVQLAAIGNSRMWKSLFHAWRANGEPVQRNREMWSTSAYLIRRPAMRAVLDAYALGGGLYNLTSLSCLNADMHLLKDPQPAGSVYVATPPLLHFGDRLQGSRVHKARDEQEFGFLEEKKMRSYLLRLSRLYSLDWASMAWRASNYKG